MINTTKPHQPPPATQNKNKQAAAQWYLRNLIGTTNNLIKHTQNTPTHDLNQLKHIKANAHTTLECITPQNQPTQHYAERENQ